MKTEAIVLHFGFYKCLNVSNLANLTHMINSCNLVIDVHIPVLWFIFRILSWRLLHQTKDQWLVVLRLQLKDNTWTLVQMSQFRSEPRSVQISSKKKHDYYIWSHSGSYTCTSFINCTHVVDLYCFFSAFSGPYIQKFCLSNSSLTQNGFDSNFHG